MLGNIDSINQKAYDDSPLYIIHCTATNLSEIQCIAHNVIQYTLNIIDPDIISAKFHETIHIICVRFLKVFNDFNGQ